MHAKSYLFDRPPLWYAGILLAKILIVDDEAPIRELAKLILEDAGYAVIGAENAEVAIQKMIEESPDLVLLDMVLQGVSGLDVCKVLKCRADTKMMPLVMITVLGRDSDKELAKESGCDGYFVKPFTPQDLVTEVQKHIKIIAE
jgi:DNA-binding response OmpR family regulator